MCNPLMIAGAAMVAGSMVVNKMAQDKVASAREGVMDQHAQAQQGYFNNELNSSQHATSGYGDVANQGQQQGQQLSQYFQQNTPGDNSKYAGADPSVPGNNDPTVSRLNAQQKQGASSYSQGLGAAFGQLRGTTQALAGANLSAANDFNNVATQKGFARGDAAVMPYQLQDANNAGGFLPILGNGLQMGGTMMLGSGITGAMGSGASGAGVGSWTQDVFGSDPGSFGRWAAGNSGQQVYGSVGQVGPFLPK